VLPASAVRVFDDIDEYTASIRAGQYEAVIAGRGAFEAKLVRIDLQRLWMQRFAETLPHIGRAATALPRLRSIHAAAGDLAEHAPAVIANAEAAHCLEQEIITAMIASSTDAAEEDKVSVKQQAILRRFRSLIEANVDNPLYLPEICTALGVSPRTLQ
jgi:hypothetical protein